MYRSIPQGFKEDRFQAGHAIPQVFCQPLHQGFIVADLIHIDVGAASWQQGAGGTAENPNTGPQVSAGCSEAASGERMEALLLEQLPTVRSAMVLVSLADRVKPQLRMIKMQGEELSNRLESKLHQLS